MAEIFVPRAQEIYRHFKGGLYQVLTVAEHTETGERMPVQRAVDGFSRMVLLVDVDHGRQTAVVVDIFKTVGGIRVKHGIFLSGSEFVIGL